MLLMLPLLLANCTCGVKLKGDTAGLSCTHTAACYVDREFCSINVNYVVGEDVRADSVIFKPNSFSRDGHDGFHERITHAGSEDAVTLLTTSVNNASHNDTFRFDPRQVTNGKFAYAFELKESSPPEICADSIPIRKRALRVAIKPGSNINSGLDPRSKTTHLVVFPGVPTALPDYLVSGSHTPPLTATWSSGHSDVVFANEPGTNAWTVLLPEGALSDRFSRSATLTVESSEPDGSIRSARVLLAFSIVALQPESLLQSPASPLVGDTVSVRYGGGGAVIESGALSWSLGVSADGIYKDESDLLVDTGDPELRTYVPLRAGKYQVRAESSRGTASSNIVVVLAPTVHIAINPPPAAISRGDTVTFDASGSTLPQGSQISWELLSKPAGAIEELEQDTSKQELATLTPDTLAGSYQVRASLQLPQVAEPFSTTRSFSFVSTPTAAAVSDQLSYDPGEPMFFSATNSVFPEGSSLEYRLLSDPAGSNAEIQLDGAGGASLVADAAGVYEIELTITNTQGESSTHVTRLTVASATGPAQPPVFATDTAAVSVAENQTLTGYTPAATDADGDTLIYTLTGGADLGLFLLIDGELEFFSAPNFEVPTDSNTDNIYAVEITATDSSTSALTATQQVLVTVTDLVGTAVALTVQNAFPVIDNGLDGAPSCEKPCGAGSDAGIYVNIDIDNKLSVVDANGAPFGEDTALYALGNIFGTSGFVALSDTSNFRPDNAFTIYDPGRETAELGFEIGVRPTITLRRNNGNYYQLTLSFDHKVTGGLMLTATNASGTNCGADRGDCPAPPAPPVFSTNTAAVSVAENQILTGYTAAATDADGDTLIYTLTDGADQGLFTLDKDNGALTFAAATDFEAPADSDTNNVYAVEITATDSSAAALTAIQTLLVTVTDLADDNAVALPVNSVFPVIDDDGGLDEAIVVDIGADDSLSVRVIPDSLVSEATALVMLGNQGTAGTVTLIDTRPDEDSVPVPGEDPWLLHSVEWGAELDITDQHKVVLLHDGEVYYQLTLSFDSKVTAEGNLTVKEVSGYNCGTFEADCP